MPRRTTRQPNKETDATVRVAPHPNAPVSPAGPGIGAPLPRRSPPLEINAKSLPAWGVVPMIHLRVGAPAVDATLSGVHAGASGSSRAACVAALHCAEAPPHAPLAFASSLVFTRAARFSLRAPSFRLTPACRAPNPSGRRACLVSARGRQAAPFPRVGCPTALQSECGARARAARCTLLGCLQSSNDFCSPCVSGAGWPILQVAASDAVNVACGDRRGARAGDHRARARCTTTKTLLLLLRPKPPRRWLVEPCLARPSPAFFVAGAGAGAAAGARRRSRRRRSRLGRAPAVVLVPGPGRALAGRGACSSRRAQRERAAELGDGLAARVVGASRAAAGSGRRSPPMRRATAATSRDCGGDGARRRVEAVARVLPRRGGVASTPVARPVFLRRPRDALLQPGRPPRSSTSAATLL